MHCVTCQDPILNVVWFSLGGEIWVCYARWVHYYKNELKSHDQFAIKVRIAFGREMKKQAKKRCFLTCQKRAQWCSFFIWLRGQDLNL